MSTDCHGDSSQQQTQTTVPCSTVGEPPDSSPSGARPAPVSKVSSLMPDNPPAYGEIAKEREAEQNRPIVTQYVGGGQGVLAVQYVIAAPTQPTIPKPNYSGPYNFLIFTVVTTIICAILNLTSLFFGIPSLALALWARDCRVNEKNYPKASKYSSVAIGLAITNICYTLLICFLMAVLIIVYRGNDQSRVFGCSSLDYFRGEYRCY